MRLYEHEAKTLLSGQGLAVPPGGPARTPEQALLVAREIGLPVVVKSQVLVGGRGKAGGIRTAHSLDDVQRTAGELLSREIKGCSPQGVLVERELAIERELYCGITIDRTRGRPQILFSSQGGVDIEHVAARDPTAIRRLNPDPLSRPCSFEILELVKGLGPTGRLMLKVRDAVLGAYRVFEHFGALTVEINPLVVTREGDVVCADAVVELDDAALFRFPELAARNMDRMNERQQRLHRKGATFVPVGGNVGLICSGAGLAMASMDLIESYTELSPANFLETGGGITAELLFDCMELVLSQRGVESVFINLYGGINPIHEGARGIARAMRDRDVQLPVVAKALGNRQEETWTVLEQAGVIVVKESTTKKAVDELARIMGAGGP